MSEHNNLPAILKESGVLSKVWDDIFSPSAKKFGTALGAVTGVILASLKKYEYYNGINDISLQDNLRRYKERIESYPDEDVVEAPPEIAVPILEKLEYTRNEDLRDAYIALLTRASTLSGKELAHPGFIHALNRLSSDEAKIVKYMSNMGGFPNLIVRATATYPAVTDCVCDPIMTGLEKEIELSMPGSIELYLNNLISLGIVSYALTSVFNSRAEALKDYYNDRIEHFRNLMAAGNCGITIVPTWIETSAFGKKFIKACTD